MELGRMFKEYDLLIGKKRIKVIASDILEAKRIAASKYPCEKIKLLNINIKITKPL